LPTGRRSSNYHVKETYEASGRAYLVVKARDVTSREQYSAAVDLTSKAATDVAEMEAREQQAYRAKYGKLEPDLYRVLQEKGPEEEVPVFIWFTSIDFDEVWRRLQEKYPDVDIRAFKSKDLRAMGGDEERAEQIVADYRELLSQLHLEKERPLAESLRSHQYDVTMYGGIPCIFVRLKRSKILEVAERDDVSAIYLGGKTPVVELDRAVPANMAPVVWDRGRNGAGKRIAIVEWDKVESNDSITVIATRPGGPPGVGSHSTEVAGCAASHHITYTGVAPQAIVMASADHNIDGPTIMRKDDYDDKDGAGAIDAALADTIASNVSVDTCAGPCWWQTVIYTNTFPIDGHLYFHFQANAGERIRVAISWHSDPAADYSSDPLSTDLDLYVYAPSWTEMGKSITLRNGYVIVDFIATETGTHEISIRRCSGTDTNYVGVAWTEVDPYLPALVWSSNYDVDSGWTSQNDFPRTAGDVSGDEKWEVVGFKQSGTYVSLSRYVAPS
jgi:hypothetical protein